MWTITNQQIVPASLWGEYRARSQLYASFGETDVFLVASDRPAVVLTPLDEHTYQLTVIEFDPAHFEDMWHLDRGKQKGSLRRFLEANGVIR